MNDTPFDVDVVITYVDIHDALWLNDFIEYTGKNPITNCRYRYFDTLKYIFRGIEYNMPWVRKVHLVVAQPSQVPDWINVNNDKLHIVYHKDIIPKELLPTFNTNHIELFLHNIKDLSEHFIYFNDDMYVINHVDKATFFTEDGKVRISMNPFKYAKDQWHRMLLNDITLLRKHYQDFNGYNSEHAYYVLLKSLCADLVNKEFDSIMSRFKQSKMRTDDDITLHIMRMYCALTGNVVQAKENMLYVHLEDKMRFPPDSKKAVICFNDTEKLTVDYDKVHIRVIKFLEKKLPNKSSYEL